MIRSTMIALAVAAMSMMFVVNSDALPLSQSQSQLTVETNVTTVADGCGRGYYFSNRRGACVIDDRDDDRPMRGGYDRPMRFGGGGGYVDPRARKDMCQQRCLQKREVCNRVKGGYFNGCGVEGAACIASCD